jgi:hypothetical protein
VKASLTYVCETYGRQSVIMQLCAQDAAGCTKASPGNLAFSGFNFKVPSACIPTCTLC